VDIVIFEPIPVGIAFGRVLLQLDRDIVASGVTNKIVNDQGKSLTDLIA
jgi:hypothetical protein